MTNQLSSRGVVMVSQHYAVTRHGAEVILSPMQFRMLEMIAGSEIGMTPEALFDRLYAGMDTPLHGRRSIHIQRVNANHKLEPLGVKITSNRRYGGPGSVYRVIAA